MKLSTPHWEVPPSRPLGRNRLALAMTERYGASHRVMGDAGDSMGYRAGTARTPPGRVRAWVSSRVTERALARSSRRATGEARDTPRNGRCAHWAGSSAAAGPAGGVPGCRG